ncbi:MAG: sigma-E processing peptidase SpoIIGA [Peptostreptococcaceae bacterium]
MYIDTYIIENLLINYIIISCTSILTKNINSKKQRLLGAILGTIYSVMYLYPSLKILFSVPAKIIFIGIITLISFKFTKKSEYIRIVIMFYLVNIFICGSTYFIIYFTGISHLKISFLIACAYISCKLLQYIYRDIKAIKHLKEFSKDIKISLLNHTCECNALLDSGNFLKDPISKNDVVIVKSSIIKSLFPSSKFNFVYDEIGATKIDEIINNLDDDLSSRVRIIPYKHAGSNEASMILGFKIDYLEVDEKKIGNVIIGISNFKDEQYSAILNPSILL